MNEDRMSAYQVGIVAICVMLNMNDGIDILALSFSAPDIIKEWTLSKAAMGYVFSAGLLGMMTGSLLIAPLCDRFGRKKIFIGSLVMITSGMLGVSICTGYGQLLILRFITGIGIGGILPALAATASEFSNEPNRDFNVGLVQAGWPIGSIITGFVCAYSIPALGWRSIFLVAGTFSILMLVMVLFFMKDESGHFNKKQALSFRRLMEPRYKNDTLFIWAAIFSGFLTLYTLMSWVPAIAKDAGLSFNIATYVGVILNAGAAIGTIAVGWIARLQFMGLKRTVFTFLLCAVVVMCVYGTIHLSTLLIFILIMLTGIFVQGGFNGNYAIMARVYPKEIRGTGVGIAIAFGRAGAILGPALFGILSDRGLSVPFLFCLFSIPLMVTAFSVISLKSKYLYGHESSSTDRG